MGESIEAVLRITRARQTKDTLAAAVFALATGISSWSSAAVDCSSLTNPVIIAGSIVLKPFIAAVAQNLSANTTIEFQGQGSCNAIDYMTTSPAKTVIGTASYWDAGGTELTCALSTGGAVVDIGVSDVYAPTCGVTPAAGVRDFLGPVQPVVFSVPITSTQQSISAEAAYMVFGFGASSAGNAIPPWTDASAIQVRSSAAGTQMIVAAALAQVGSGMRASAMKGVSNTSDGNLVTALVTLAAANYAEKAIGVLGTAAFDANRAILRALSFQFPDQTCGFLPDSSSTSLDKQNVRDGHYALWGASHLFTPVSVDGTPLNPSAALVIDYLTGGQVPPFDLISLEASKGAVPNCAMRVSRTAEMGPMASYMPAKSCECKFVAAATGNASQNCKACVTNTQCPASAPACNYGYCEVQ